MMQAHARYSDPITSHRAAEAVTPDLARVQRMVLGYAKGRGDQGFTDVELEGTLGDHGSTYRTRRSELTDKGMIRDTGRRVRLKGEARQRIVWAITPLGRRALPERRA